MDLSVARELDSPTVISDEVGGEVLAINIGTGAYFVIPPGCTPVWSALTSGVPAESLLNGRNDPREPALRQFLAVLVDRGLLREAGTSRELPDQPEWAPTDLNVEEHTDLADLIWLDVIHEVDENVGWPVRRTSD